MSDRKNQNLDNYLILRPFPQFKSSDKKLEIIWREYRESFIPLAGIAIFIFGNKVKGEEIILADGMKEEFDIAVSKGLKVIPIGSTGYMAKELHGIVMKEFEKYFPENPELEVDFGLLGDINLDAEKIISILIKILKNLNK